MLSQKTKAKDAVQGKNTCEVCIMPWFNPQNCHKTANGSRSKSKNSWKKIEQKIKHTGPGRDMPSILDADGFLRVQSQPGLQI